MPYWRMFYHVVWATKQRQPLITPDIEAIIFPVIIQKSRELGAFVYALNGTPDHVHLVAAIPPRIGVGDFVGQIKGRATRAVHHNFESDFAWQAGYGVHTFGEKHLSTAADYVRRQKEHHASDNALYGDLERCTDDNDGPPIVLPD
jgi:putative transposase